MNENKIQWERSVNKRVWEKRKHPRYLIYPNYMGTPKVQWYNIKYYGEAGWKNGAQAGEKMDCFGYTQSEAKQAVQMHANIIQEKREADHKKWLEQEEKEMPANMLKYRRERFYVRITQNINPGKFDFDELYLKVSHNGTQEMVIGFTIPEAKMTVLELLKVINPEGTEGRIEELETEVEDLESQMEPWRWFKKDGGTLEQLISGDHEWHYVNTNGHFYGDTPEEAIGDAREAEKENKEEA